ncbi:MAG: class I SAM-dependent methyltransferase [Sedimentisphaerales bacterium]|nr:class I SAM-dependent methyltransferase [Sedimentisphaerales bacterium]
MIKNTISINSNRFRQRRKSVPKTAKNEPNEQINKLAQLLNRSKRNVQGYIQNFWGPCLKFLHNANILDVGCGPGATTFSAAIWGAKQVIGLEPQAAGSSQGSQTTFNKIKNELKLHQCKLEPIDFLKYNPDNPFDIVLFYDSINHIRETTADIRYDTAARQEQKQIIAHVRQVTATNGWVIMCDCSRKNFFGDFGIPSPVMPTINWKTHQCAAAWRSLLQEEGFGNLSINWRVPPRIKWAKPILDNAFVNYLTFSHFILRAQKLP